MKSQVVAPVDAQVSVQNPGCDCQIRVASRVQASQAVVVANATVEVGAKIQMMVRPSAYNGRIPTE